MKKRFVKELVLGGLFIALGLILPIIFHVFGAGTALLPMHIPVLIAGFVLSMPAAVMVGAITPILSSTLTGMPPVFPVLPFMIVELAVYSGAASLLYRRLKLNIYLALVGSMFAGRVASSIVVWILSTFFMAKLPSPLVFITGGIVQGIPGIIIQLIFVPITVYALKKSRVVDNEEGIKR